MKRFLSILLSIAVFTTSTAYKSHEVEADSDIELGGFEPMSEPVEEGIGLEIKLKTVSGNEVIEISNPTDTAISCKGLYLSNDVEEPFMWQMPSVIVRPGESAIFAGEGDNDTAFLKRCKVDFKIAVNYTVPVYNHILLSTANGEYLNCSEVNWCKECNTDDWFYKKVSITLRNNQWGDVYEDALYAIIDEHEQTITYYTRYPLSSWRTYEFNVSGDGVEFGYTYLVIQHSIQPPQVSMSNNNKTSTISLYHNIPGISLPVTIARQSFSGNPHAIVIDDAWEASITQ